MPLFSTNLPSCGPAVETHFLGQVELERCQALQRRLVAEVAGRSDGQIRLLMCEHPSVITVGRGGDPTQIQASPTLLRSRELEVRWVNRGGGCLVHALGQLAVYPIFPLKWHHLSLGEYINRIQTGIFNTLETLGIPVHTQPGRHGIWGRTGQLVAFGVAVRDWVAYHGAFINVCPPMGLLRLVSAGLHDTARMSCLVAERCGPVKMTTVRAELVRCLTDAFGCDRYHLYTGHPWLRVGGC